VERRERAAEREDNSSVDVFITEDGGWGKEIGRGDLKNRLVKSLERYSAEVGASEESKKKKTGLSWC
jgi:hypothetical protein